MTSKTTKTAAGRSFFLTVSAVVLCFAPAGLAQEESERLRFFMRGDATVDGTVDMTDAIEILSTLFLGGDDLLCEDAADTDDNGEVDISDAVTTLNYLFKGKVVIPPPGPDVCGLDSTDDRLECGDAGFCEPELQLLRTNQSEPENEAKMWELMFLYGFSCGKAGSGAYHCEKCDDDGDCRVFICDLAGTCVETTQAAPTGPTRQRDERATETKSAVLHQAILEEQAPAVVQRQVLLQTVAR